MKHLRKIFFRSQIEALVLGSLLAVGCTSELDECQGPALDLNLVRALRSGASRSADQSASLILPNPIVASGGSRVLASDPRLQSLINPISILNLVNPNRLETDFIKIRRNSINESTAGLARPNSQGNFNFPVNDVRYSEALAYYSVDSILTYVEALGFSIVKTRPLFVLVRSQTEGQAEDEINAFYEHGYLNPTAPRIMRLVGDTEFAPGIDRDMYWHEFGHLMNESVSGEVGIDFALDSGAIYTEGSALHECLADYLPQSVGNTPEIGAWIASNFPEFSPGAPLRTAVDSSQRKLQFKDVALADGTGAFPERYQVSEWCTRVLWEVRDQFVKESFQDGPIFSDILMLSALSLLRQDTSLTEFRNAMIEADEELYCGLHKRSINQAFESRGFKTDVPKLSQPLELQAAPVGVQVDNEGGGQLGQIRPGGSVTFRINIQNNSNQIARNVRLILESDNPQFVPITYMQTFGDVGPNKSLTISEQGPMPFDFSVWGDLSRSAGLGGISYRLRLIPENGEETVLTGVL